MSPHLILFRYFNIHTNKYFGVMLVRYLRTACCIHIQSTNKFANRLSHYSSANTSVEQSNYLITMMGVQMYPIRHSFVFVLFVRGSLE